jgi:hypothetical protein
MDLRLQPTANGLTRVLGLSTGILVLAHLIGVFCHLVLHTKAEAYMVLFDLDLEANLPTFFNSLLFFLCAGLMILKGLGRTHVLRRGWYTLAAVFMFLGIDEGSQIHEKFMLVTLRLLNHGAQTGTSMGWLYYAWVIPYGAAAALLVMILGRWLWHLDPVLRKGLFLSGAVYVFGAVVMEMYSGKLAEGANPVMTAEQLSYIPCEIYPAGSCHLYTSFAYIAAYTLEETCEMVGLILCIRMLVKALERRGDVVEIRLGAGG